MLFQILKNQSILYKAIFFLLSLTKAMVEKVLFLGEIFEMEILMDLHVMRSHESENPMFSIWFACPLSASLKNKLQQKQEIQWFTFVPYIDAT